MFRGWKPWVGQRERRTSTWLGPDVKRGAASLLMSVCSAHTFKQWCKKTQSRMDPALSCSFHLQPESWLHKCLVVLCGSKLMDCKNSNYLCGRHVSVLNDLNTCCQIEKRKLLNFLPGTNMRWTVRNSWRPSALSLLTAWMYLAKQKKTRRLWPLCQLECGQLVSRVRALASLTKSDGHNN